ncbi:MAG: cyclic nucleotide-binding domain-containing protein [Dehalococcoidia bacterium]
MAFKLVRSQKVDALSGVPLFSGLSKSQLSLVERSADEVHADAGAVLAREGGLGREFLLILDGRARVERNKRKLAQLGRGDFFGEMSLIDGEPRSASVIAETPVTLLVMEGRSFRAVLEDAPPMARKIMMGLCQRLRRADDELASRN